MAQVNPNPQGKGLVPVLAALAQVQQGMRVVPKQVGQFAMELFTSLFVLESRFQFKPVRGRQYWLYRYGPHFQLSPLAPQQWSAPTFDLVVGCCELHDDLVWTLELTAEAAQDTALLHYLQQRRAQFQESLQASTTLQAALPVYVPTLPFYQRVYAAALASSLGRSLHLAGIAQLPYQQTVKCLVDETRSAV